MATYESAIPYIQKAEGGLSRAVTDTAHLHPSPYVYKGQIGWHTNRGITWQTFSGMAPKVGYAINQSNFINMPDSVWLGIYKKGFWDDMKGDSYVSQPVANGVVDFAWAAGGGGARKSLHKFLSTKGYNASDSTSIANSFNDLVKKEGEAKVFNELIDHRKQFFKSLKQPANEPGWLSRMETLRQQGMSIVGQGATATARVIKKNPIIAATVTALLIVSAYVLYTQLKKK